MFGVVTNAVIKNIGAQESLIPNENLDKKMKLLTLVRIRQRNLRRYPKYTVMACMLSDLMEGEEVPKAVKEEVLVEKFLNLKEIKLNFKAKGGHGAVADGELAGHMDTVDGQVEPVSIKKKETDLSMLRKLISGRKIQKEKVKHLKLKKNDKLAFVYKKVYNSGPVTLIKNSCMDGSISASCQKMINLLFKGSNTEKTAFEIPEKAMFAYGLIEIMLEDEIMELSWHFWTHEPLCRIAQNHCFSLTEEKSLPFWDEIKLQAGRGIKNDEPSLKPLVDLPESTRCDLLRNLKAVLEEEDALSLLEEMLDESLEGESECPQSQVVSSFMELINVSNVSMDVKNALHVLVSAMDTLPDGMQQPLISCSPEPLRVLCQMVDGLNVDCEVKVPESLPAPLQEDGELHWAVEFICSTNEEFAKLGDMWGRSPKILLEVLALTILGLYMLQPKE